MVLRSDSDGGVLAIGQASHAWVSGQLARAWGNARFGAVEPWEEVCLGAEQHDIGMATWDLEPTLNPGTGLPHSFIEMPIETHLELWSTGPRRLLRQCRYASLLTSMHGVRLYEMRDLDTLAPHQAEAIREFMDGQRQFQQDLVTALTANPDSSAAAQPELIARNSDLIWTWDFLSLALCLDWAPCTAHEVPTASEDQIDLQLEPGDEPRAVTFDPWPFADRTVTVRCEGQRLAGTFETAADLHAALAKAPWETLEIGLAPAES